MASSMGIKTAVSDYEHLNRKNHHKYTVEQQPNYSSEDEDFLPLKPRKPIHVLKNQNVHFHEIANVNNSSVAARSEIIGHAATVRTELFGDMEQSLKSVPVPMAWSPGMRITTNPSLFITPQKSSGNEPFSSAKENILEPQNSNTIPKPTAWSPGMIAKPDPNLFITPEKCESKKITGNIAGGDKEKATENHIKRVSTKNKESYSVRFDLPSSTSEDETSDPFSDSHSPITLTGCQMSEDRQSFESPIWKTFSPPKRYNPITYSDESLLDDSNASLSSNAKINPSYNLLKTSCATDSVSDNSSIKLNNIFSKLPKSTSEVSSCHASVLNPYRQSETNQHIVTGSISEIKPSGAKLKPQRMEPSKSNIPLTSKAKIQSEKKKLDDKSIAKAVPHSLSSLSSPHEPPSPSSTVIREMKNNLLSTEYSFPFDQIAAAEDCEYESVFARPEFNSTLKVRAEMDNLYEQEVDVWKAVETNLAKSEVKRLELNEKAAVYTNRMSSQFTNLIDLNTSVESLCDRIVRMRTSKAPSKKRGTQLEKKSAGPYRAPPDLMEFFTSDVQKECPDLTLPGVTHVTSTLMTAPQDVAFDLYRHNRLWQGIHDFLL